MKLRDWLFGTLRRQLAVGVALVHAVMMSVFVFDLVVRQQEVLQARQADEARSLARTLALSARAWVLTRDLAGLAELTRIDGDNGVEYMMLIDARGEVPAHIKPEVGQALQLSLQDGVLNVVVSRVDENELELDGNHPLAGKTLHFAIEIVEVREAAAEEVEHGHVHGDGGHAH